MARTNRDEWAKRVERWRRSGLTAKEFAEQHGLRPSSLSWWKWHLAQQRPLSAPPVVEVVGLTLDSSHRPAPIELQFPNGLRVLVPTAFEPETLRRLLGVLEGR